jgi:polyisoprenoid-binding protein YceI
MFGCHSWAFPVVMDTDNSSINFEIRHLMSKATGRFNTFQGKGELNLEDPGKSKIEVVIDVSSIHTGNPARDNHLRTADFFDVAHYPKATFQTKKVVKTSETTYRLEGDFTMRGITRLITFDLNLLGEDYDQAGKKKIGFLATATLNRSDFNINFNVAGTNGTWVIGDQVQIKFYSEWSPATSQSN